MISLFNPIGIEYVLSILLEEFVGERNIKVLVQTYLQLFTHLLFGSKSSLHVTAVSINTSFWGTFILY